MAKIARAVQKIFGSTASAGQIKQFGSLAAAAPLSTTDPATIQALSNYLDGWFAGVLGSNSPTIEDMNALCYLFAYQLAYGFQEGVAEWNAATTYYVGSIINSAGTLYISLADDNLNHAITDTTYWKPQFAGILRPTAVNTLAVGIDLVLADPSGTASFNQVLSPVASYKIGARVTVKNVAASGVNTVTPQGNGTEKIDFANLYQALNPGESVTMVTDQVQWWVV